MDFSRPKVKEDAPLNLNKATTYEEPSRTASAKQHYLKQSRYLPGNILEMYGCQVSMDQNIFLFSALLAFSYTTMKTVLKHFVRVCSSWVKLKMK